MKTSTEFSCKCGQTGWIAEGEVTHHCPSCGRRYKGVYDKKKLIIKAVLIGTNRKNKYIGALLTLTPFVVLFGVSFLFIGWTVFWIALSVFLGYLFIFAGISLLDDKESTKK